MSVVEILPSVQLILSRYELPTCFAFGMIGCVFNITIFLKKLRSNACSIYMLAINIVNLIEIPYSFGRVSVIYYLPISSRPSTSIYCRMISYFQHYLLNVVRTYTVFACIDRFAICSKHARIRAFSSTSLARKLVIIATIIWFIIPIHMAFLYEYLLPGRCGVAGIYGIVFSIYSAIVTGGHLILMIVFSSLAIYSIHRGHFRIQPTTVNQGNNVNRIKKKDLQLIKMLIGEVIVYILTSGMFPIFTIYSVVTQNTNKTPSRAAIDNFLSSLSPDCLVVINPCTTFYV